MDDYGIIQLFLEHRNPIPTLNGTSVIQGLFTGDPIRPSAVSGTNRETSDVCPEGKLFSNSTVVFEDPSLEKQRQGYRLYPSLIDRL